MPETPGAGPAKYDLGGVWPRPGYITVNLVPGADRQCDITNLDRLHPSDGEVEEFLLIHTLEHIPVTKYVRFIRDLHRIHEPVRRCHHEIRAARRRAIRVTEKVCAEDEHERRRHREPQPAEPVRREPSAENRHQQRR